MGWVTNYNAIIHEAHKRRFQGASRHVVRHHHGLVRGGQHGEGARNIIRSINHDRTRRDDPRVGVRAGAIHARAVVVLGISDAQLADWAAAAKATTELRRVELIIGTVQQSGTSAGTITRALVGVGHTRSRASGSH